MPTKVHNNTHKNSQICIFSLNYFLKGNLCWMVFFLVWKINCFWFDSHYQVGNILPSSITRELKLKTLFGRKLFSKNDSKQIQYRMSLTQLFIFLFWRNLITFPLYKVSLSSLLLELLCNNNFILLVAVSAVSSNKYFSLIYSVQCSSPFVLFLQLKNTILTIIESFGSNGSIECN